MLRFPDVALLLALALSPQAFGQQAAPRQAIPAPRPLGPQSTVTIGQGGLPTPIAAVAEGEGPRMDFSFQNLPLAEAIKIVQATYHKESDNYLNVMIPEHLRELSETNYLNLEVKQVTVDELFDLLQRASQQSVQYGNPLSPMNQIGTIGYTLELVSAKGGNLTYLLGYVFPPGAPIALPQREEIRSVRFFQLEPYLDRYTVEDITTAVKTGWDLAGFKTIPTMKYHDETKLLIVSGEPDQIGLLEQVLRGLTPQAGVPTIPRRVDPPAYPAQPTQPNLPQKSEKP